MSYFMPINGAVDTIFAVFPEVFSTDPQNNTQWSTKNWGVVHQLGFSKQINIGTRVNIPGHGVITLGFDPLPFLFYYLDYDARQKMTSTLSYTRFNTENKPAIREELIHRCRSNPYDMLNWLYLNKYSSRLNINSNDVPSVFRYIGGTGACRWVYDGGYYVFRSHYIYKTFMDLLFVSPEERIRDFMIEFLRSPRGMEILPYSARVEQHIQVNTDRTRIMGVELELTARAGALEYAHTILKNHAIFKRDGSVPNGFEIVTIPALLTEHLEPFRKFFERAETLFIAENNCGMHVHMTRKGLSFLQIAKMVEFLNNPENKSLIQTVAGRYNNQYCRPDHTKNISNMGELFNSGEFHTGERYSLLNLQPAYTVEVRAFASTTSQEVFFSRLEFCDALRAYTTPGALSIPAKESVKAEVFQDWLLQPGTRKQYPNLVRTVKTL